jgi:hypothetical protein
MALSISWSDLDTNAGTKGYLDKTEVEKAKKMGVTNVFENMIQAEYEGTLDVDTIREKYDHGANGKRLPIYGSEKQRNNVIKLYREFTVLKCKYENLKEEFDKKYGIVDDLKDLLSKIKIFKSDTEYNSYKSKLEELKAQMNLKEKELDSYINDEFYQKYSMQDPDTIRLTVYTAWNQ